MTNEKRPLRHLKTYLGNIRYSLAIYWADYKLTLIICAAAVVLRIALPYLNMLLPKLVIDELTARAAPMHFIKIVGGFSLLLVLVNFLKSYTDFISENAVGTTGISLFMKKQLDRLMEIDFALMEDPDFKRQHDKAQKAIQSNHSLSMNIPRTLVRLISNALGFLLYVSVIASIHPAILLLLLACSAVNWLMLSRARKYDENTREARSKTESKLRALFDTMRDSASTKDIRLYSTANWFHGLLDSLMGRRIEEESAVEGKMMAARLTEALMILLRDGAAYAFLLYLLLNGRLSLGDFVFVFAAIGGLAEWISGTMTAASDLAKSCVEMGDIRAAFTYPNRMNTGAGAPLPRGENGPPSLEMRNVSYTYPEADKKTLENINLTIEPGERIAIVGANGAGKTTLVKLLCGLYLPTEGDVLLAGQSVLTYNRDEYYQMFSTVFQDIHLLTCDIAGNISQKTPEETDPDKVTECLRLSGLSDKVERLPEKEKTLLVRSINPDAVELSGGELQKLAMARALYKNMPVIILDEPTAALDPIAENEVYARYAELTYGKTSVYISHRLASTRFCDRILLIDGNHLAEQGTHEELMRLGGVYAHMFTVQASYYQDMVSGVSAEEAILNG